VSQQTSRSVTQERNKRLAKHTIVIIYSEQKTQIDVPASGLKGDLVKAKYHVNSVYYMWFPSAVTLGLYVLLAR